MYAKRADPALIFGFLQSRDESRLKRPSRLITSEVALREDLLLSLRYLFFGRHIISPFTEPILIGAMDSPENTLSLAIKWYAQVGADEQGILKRVVLSPEDYERVDNPSPRFTIQLGSSSPVNYPLTSSTTARRIKAVWKEINSVYAKTNFLTKIELSRLWDNIVLTKLDDEVLEALRIVAPGVEGLTFVGDTESLGQEREQERERIPVVKITGIDERLPLGHLGDGMQRMLSVALALVNSKDGILLIDEIENGLHYLVQPDLWRLVFKLAQLLNVQVFATTHSWDCIEAFQEAAQEDNQEGMLIRLQSKKGEISATVYDEEELKIATRGQIEVR